MKNLKSIALCLAFLCFSCFSFSNQSFAAQTGEKDMNSNLMIYESTKDFETVYRNIISFIISKDLTIFAEYDHAQNAEKVDLQLNPTRVIVFGNPLVGTKLMQQNQYLALELPLKVVVYQDEKGKTYVAHQKLSKFFPMYGLNQDNEIMMKMEGLLNALATKAVE